ncbi:MAG: STAS domain-containing protein [Rhodoferax sp.]
MAVKENNGGLLARVASLMRKEERAALDGSESSLDRGTDSSHQALRARVEQKRRDDIIRRREFDYLRKIRSNGIATSSYVAGRPQAFQSSGGYQEAERLSTVKKINDIEAQMSKHWWGTRKQDEAAALAQAPSKPAKPVIASVRLSADDPVAGEDLLEGFEFATAPAAMALPPLGAEGAPPAVPVLREVAPGAAPGAAPAGAPASRPPADAVVVGFVPSMPSAMDSGISGFSNSKLISIEMGATLGDPDLQEASIRFAEGDADTALKMLVAGLVDPQTKVETAQTYAAAVFDLYRATGQREAFDHFAMEYAQRFGSSPPEWYSMPEAVAARRAARAAPSQPRADEWTCPEVLEVPQVQALEQAMQGCKGRMQVQWGALRSLSLEAAPLLSTLFARWAGTPVELVFSGIPALLKVLKASTPGGDIRTPQVWWQLRMHVLRTLGLMDDFEQVALDFCLVYELSPPSWEPPLCTCQHEMAASGGDAAQGPHSAFDGAASTVFGLLSANESVVVPLDGELQGDVEPQLTVLTEGLQDGHPLLVSCSHLIRVDFGAAGCILNWVAQLEAQSCHVQFQDVSRLVAAFFNVIGISDHASVVLRAR